MQKKMHPFFYYHFTINSHPILFYNDRFQFYYHRCILSAVATHYIYRGALMPVIIEAILVSASMLFIFSLAFLSIYLLAITMMPIERSLSKIIWDATTPKRPAPAPPKGSFRDFSRKH